MQYWISIYMNIMYSVPIIIQITVLSPLLPIKYVYCQSKGQEFLIMFVFSHRLNSLIVDYILSCLCQ